MNRMVSSPNPKLDPPLRWAFRSLALLLTLALALPQLGRAQSLVTYPVNSIANGDNTSTFLNPTGVDQNIVASPIRLHYQVNYNPGNSPTTLSGPQSDAGLFAMFQFPGALTYDPTSPQYLEFSLSPKPGFLLNIPSILLTLRGKPNGPKKFDFRASLDNFERTNPTATSDVLLNTYTPTDVNGGKTLTSTLPAAFLNTTKTIYFRAYGYNAANNGGNEGDKPGGIFQNPDGSNFSISGTAPMRLAALDDRTTTPFNTPVTFAATANDGPSISATSVDLDPNTPGIQTTFTTAQGTFTTVGAPAGSVTFTPATGFTGTAVIPYVAQSTTGAFTNQANLIVTVPAPAPAELSTTISASATTVAAGAPVTLTVVGTNNTTAPAANVQETLALPAGLTASGFTINGAAVTSTSNGVFTFADGSTYNQNTGLVTFPATSLTASGTAGSSVTYSVVFKAPNSGPFTGTAQIGNGTLDPVPANNAASVVINVTPSTNFDLTTALAGPTSTTAGDAVTYTVLTTNNGPGLASAAVQSVSVPAGITGVFTTNGGVYNPTTNTVTFPAVPLAAGKTVANTVSFTAPAATYSVTALVTPNTTATNDTNPANNTAALSTTVNPASGTATNLYVTVSGPALVAPGQTGVTYTVTEGNKGPVTASTVATVVSLPTGLNTSTLALNGAAGTFNSTTGLVTFGTGSGNGNTATYNVNTGVLTLPTLASQAVANTQTYSISLTAPFGGPSYPVVASVSTTTPETVAADNVAVVVTEETAPLDLATVISGPATTMAGQLVTYAVTTTNNSSVSAASVVQTVNIPAGLSGLLVNGGAPTATNATTGVQTFAGGATYDPRTGVLTFATLSTFGAGALVENTFTYPAPGNLTTLTNVASVSTTSPDGQPANNVSTALTTVSPVVDVTVVVSGPAVGLFGDLVTYEVTTTNNGPSLSGQTTTAQLPTGLSGVLVRDAAGNLLTNSATTGYNSLDGVVRFPAVASQATGAANALTGTIQLPMPDVARLDVTAVVAVPAGTVDANLANNASTVVTVGGSPAYPPLDVQITLTSNLGTQTAGQPVVFTVTSTNNSTTTAAANLTQLVSLPAGLSGVKVNNAAPTATDATTGVQTFAGGATYDPRTGVLTLPAIASLAAATSAPVTTITVNAPGTGPLVATAVVGTDNLETNNANNTATAPVIITPSTDVATTITGPATTIAGAAVTYTVTTSNNGPSPAPNLVQTVTIPANASASTPVASGGGSVSGSPSTGYTVTFPGYTAQAGSTVANTITFVAGTLASYTLTATVPTAGDPITANNTSTQTTTETNRPPVANDVVNGLQAPEGNTAGQLFISPLVANDFDGTVVRYNLTSIPTAAQGVLYYNNGGIYTAIASADLATLNLTPAQAQTLRFDPVSTFVGTASFLYTATDNNGAVSNVAQYTIPVGQDNNSFYTSTPTKGGANAYATNDVLAYVLDPNATSYNSAGLVYNPNGTAAAGTVSNGLPTTGTTNALLAASGAGPTSNPTNALPSGTALDPTTGLVFVSNAALLPRITSPTTYQVNIITTDLLGGVNTVLATFVLGAFPLPVELVSFTAQAVNQTNAQLVWRTASEKNNDHFDVERSLNGTDYAKIGQVKGQGTSSASTDYALTDAGIGAKATGTVYYRLKQVDADGTATYSPVRTVAFAKTQAATFALYPNPATTTTTLDLSRLPAGTYQVTVLDLTGRRVLGFPLNTLAPQVDLRDLSRGAYLVQINGTANGQSVRLTQRLTKE